MGTNDVVKHILYVKISETNNKIREIMRKNLENFVEFLKDKIQGKLIELSGEDILGWYWDYKAKKEKTINKNLPRISEAFESGNKSEIEKALKTIDFLALYRFYNEEYDNVINNEKLPYELRSYALDLKKAHMEVMNKRKDFVLYLLRIIDHIENLYFFQNVLRKLLQWTKEEKYRSIILNKISILSKKYLNNHEKFKEIMFFIANVEYLSTKNSNILTRLYKELTPYKNIEDINVDDFLRIYKCSLRSLYYNNVQWMLDYRLLIIYALSKAKPKETIKLLKNEIEDLMENYDLSQYFLWSNEDTLYQTFKTLMESGNEEIQSSTLDLMYTFIKRVLEYLSSPHENSQKDDTHNFSFNLILQWYFFMGSRENLFKDIKLEKSAQVLYNIYKLVKNLSLEKKEIKGLRWSIIHNISYNPYGYKYLFKIYEEECCTSEKNSICESIIWELKKYKGNKEVADFIYSLLEKIDPSNKNYYRYFYILSALGVEDYGEKIVNIFENMLKARKIFLIEILKDIPLYNKEELALKLLNILSTQEDETILSYYHYLFNNEFWSYVMEHADETWYEPIFNILLKVCKVYFTRDNMILKTLLSINKDETLKRLYDLILNERYNENFRIGMFMLYFYNDVITNEEIIEGLIDLIFNHIDKSLIFLFKIPKVVREKINTEPITAHEEDVRKVIEKLIEMAKENKENGGYYYFRQAAEAFLVKYFEAKGDALLPYLEECGKVDEILIEEPIIENPTPGGFQKILEKVENLKKNPKSFLWNLNNFIQKSIELKRFVGFGELSEGDYPEILEYILKEIDKYLKSEIKDEEGHIPPLEWDHNNLMIYHELWVLIYLWKEYGLERILNLIRNNISAYKKHNIAVLIKSIVKIAKNLGIISHNSEIKGIIKEMLKIELKNIILNNEMGYNELINLLCQEYQEL